MENLKELKKEFEQLLNNNKIVVEVKTNNKTVNYLLNEKSNIASLISYLYQKAVLQAHIQIRYKNNFTDFQTISITQKFTTFDGREKKMKYIYYNIPTYQASLNIDKILEVE